MTVVVDAVEANPGKSRKRPLGRLRLQALPDASAASLQGFIAADTEKPLAVATDGWGDASLRLPAIHLVFSLAKRRLLGTHHGAVRRDSERRQWHAANWRKGGQKS